MNQEYFPSISEDLFWDCHKPTSRADWQLHGTAIIERVLERGELEDFREIARYYGTDKLREVFATSRRISRRVRWFGAALFGDSILTEAEECTHPSCHKRLWPY
jgi:hypothetical protein